MANMKLYTFNGETMALREWSRKLGVSRATLIERLYAGWTPERTFTTPTISPRDKRGPRTRGGCRPISSPSTGTGLGSVALERGQFDNALKSENQPSNETP